MESIEEQSRMEVPPDESARGAALDVREQPGLGAYQADADGRALYFFTADTVTGASSCYDECAEVWHPMIAEGGTPRVTAPGLSEELVGTIERSDGRTQVTWGCIRSTRT